MKSSTAIVRELAKRESRFYSKYGAEKRLNKEIYNKIMKEDKTHAKRDSSSKSN